MGTAMRFHGAHKTPDMLQERRPRVKGAAPASMMPVDVAVEFLDNGRPTFLAEGFGGLNSDDLRERRHVLLR
jgi:hypothetical protein